MKRALLSELARVFYAEAAQVCDDAFTRMSRTGERPARETHEEAERLILIGDELEAKVPDDVSAKPPCPSCESIDAFWQGDDAGVRMYRCGRCFALRALPRPSRRRR